MSQRYLQRRENLRGTAGNRENRRDRNKPYGRHQILGGELLEKRYLLSALAVFGEPAIISTSPNGATSAISADLNSDGHADVLWGDFGGDQVVWAAGDGTGQFRDQHVIATGLDQVQSLCTADINADGDLDVIAASSRGWSAPTVWYENLGGARSFATHTIGTNAWGTTSVVPADVDRDGDLDVLTATVYASTTRLVWYETRDGGQVFEAHHLPITIDEPINVFAADMDGDSDIDILAAFHAGNAVAWYENDGSQTFTEHVVSQSVSSARSVVAADMDQDGDMDVISASWNDNKVAWYENDGKQRFTQHIVSTDVGGANDALPVDLDADGDLDIVSAATEAGVVIWHENDGQQIFSDHILATDLAGISSVFVSDMDEDGDLDVLFASGSENASDSKVGWCEQLGTPDPLPDEPEQDQHLPTVNVGQHDILPDTPHQAIPVYVRSSEAIEGVDLYVQIGDGGIGVGGADTGPRIEGIDLLSGTIFQDNHSGIWDLDNNAWWPGGEDGILMFEGLEMVTDQGAVPADGLLAIIYIDTTGFREVGQTWELRLAGTVNGDTDFGLTAAAIINGSVRIRALPTADPGAGYTLDEGGVLALDATGSTSAEAGSALVAYQWDLDGDGVFGETGAEAQRGNETGPSPVFSAAGLDGPTTWTVRLQVIDDQGLTSAITSTEIVVENAAAMVRPLVTTLEWATSSELVALATFSDPGASDTHSATIDWGDGTVEAGLVEGSAGSGIVLGSHSYAVPGDYRVVVTVTDDDGANGTSEFIAQVSAAHVVGRYVFYNNSAWDGRDAGANAADDWAIAPNPDEASQPSLGKTALLPGEQATFRNYTSYARGLNGIMIDIAGLANPEALTPDDFLFRVGNDDYPALWATAPIPQVSVRLGAGQNGSDRVTLIWPDYLMRDAKGSYVVNPAGIGNQWLQVTVLATPNTRLAAEDVFYFGNAVGETGNSADDALVNAADQIGTRNNRHTLANPAPLWDEYDFDRDLRVNATDELLARSNRTDFGNALQLITAIGDIPGGTVVESIVFSPERILDAVLFNQEPREQYLVTVNPSDGAVTPSRTMVGPYMVGDIDSAPDGYLYATHFSGAMLRVEPATASNTLAGCGQLGALGGIASLSASELSPSPAGNEEAGTVVIGTAAAATDATLQRHDFTAFALDLPAREATSQAVAPGPSVTRQKHSPAADPRLFAFRTTDEDVTSTTASSQQLLAQWAAAYWRKAATVDRPRHAKMVDAALESLLGEARETS